MSQPAASQPLKILVVTEDRAQQRQLSHFFDMMGYQAHQAAEAHSALAAVEAHAPHIILIGSDLGARNDWELCRTLAQAGPGGGAFTLLIIEQSDEGRLHEALEAGVDDFLLQPIGYGELLSRLRAAARVLEFDRRAARQERQDATTGLPSRSAVIAALQPLLSHRGGAARVACVALDLDSFARVNRAQGPAAGDTLLQAVAQELRNLAGTAEIVASLSADRFCVVLAGVNDTAAAEWAEHARQTLAATKFKLGETTWQVTASLGVASAEPHEAPDHLVERAVAALLVAKASGRNCVIRSGEINPDELQSTAPNKLLERTVARDVMTPCTVFLQPSETVGQAVELLHRTRLDGIAVVDAAGTLVGLCEQEQVASVPENQYASRTVREWMTTEVQSFSERDTLAALLEFLGRDQRSLVMVLDEERPVGFVTRDSLLAMSQRLGTGSFATELPYSDSSDYLLVPDLAPADCEHTT